MAGTEKMTPEQWRAFQAAQALAEESQDRSKYGNIRVVVDGITFDSHKEAKYYGQCKIRVLIKELVRFERQVTFEISVNGVHICDYRADFVLHYPDGRTEVVDVKSSVTKKIAVYRLKKALMLAVHKIKIVEK